MTDPVMLWGHPAEFWTALAALSTAAIAFVAAVFAFFQVREARAVREAQAQPFVVVDIAPSREHGMFFDLIIRNIGSTLAKDVRIEVTPPLHSGMNDRVSSWLLLTEGIPSMPPGKEYRSVFDVSFGRENLPNRYEFTVRYSDRDGREMKPLKYVTDLDVYLKSEVSIEQSPLRDIAKSVQGIESSLRRGAGAPSLRRRSMREPESRGRGSTDAD